MAAFYFGQAIGEPLGWSSVLNVTMGVFYPVLIGFGQVQTRKAIRRRLFIYEALRELSDADDEGVELTEAVAQADLLIDRITALELEGDPRPLRRTRTRA
jgi:hypothetical protein